MRQDCVPVVHAPSLIWSSQAYADLPFLVAYLQPAFHGARDIEVRGRKVLGQEPSLGKQSALPLPL